MAEAVCLRSLWATLTAATSTFGLFAAANWGLASLVGETRNQGLLKQIAGHTMFAFAMPVLVVNVSLSNAFKVWAVKRALHIHYAHQPELCPQHSSISIITLCPIYIKIPAIQPTELSGGHLAQYKPVTASELKKLHPLELHPSPRVTYGIAVAHDNSTPDQWMYLALPPTYDFQDAGERYALLASGLPPEDSELRYLRARNSFQSAVTAFQAFGYVLSTTERIIQHIDISPVEAIITYLSILTVLQLVIEIYACGNYQRPLLVCLHHDQLLHFRNAPRKDVESLVTWRQTLILTAFTVALGLLATYPSMYYFSHFAHVCTICSLTAMFFFLSLLVYGFLPKAYLVYTPSQHAGNIPALVFINVLFVCSIILAVISTIAHWKLFQESTHHRLAQIFPHLSS